MVTGGWEVATKVQFLLRQYALVCPKPPWKWRRSLTEGFVITEPQHPRHDGGRPGGAAPPLHGRPHRRGEEVPARRREGRCRQRQEVSRFFICFERFLVPGWSVVRFRSLLQRERECWLVSEPCEPPRQKYLGIIRQPPSYLTQNKLYDWSSFIGKQSDWSYWSHLPDIWHTWRVNPTLP